MTTTARAKPRGYPTEYTDNFTADKLYGGSRNKDASGLFDGKALGSPMSYPVGDNAEVQRATGSGAAIPEVTDVRDPAVFSSQIYPSVYRESVIHKDDRGKYIDPFKNLASKPYGRRLIYDPSHPDKMYASQWSSELADNAGCYSFPTTTDLEPELPFKRDLQWQSEGEVGSWPTDHWRQWTQTACSPTYDGHDDQVEYSKYKVHVP